MAENELIVKDSEFLETADGLTAFANALQSATDQYSMILDLIVTQAVSSGKTHDALIGYRAYVQRISEAIGTVIGKIQSIPRSFLSELDEADEYLYDAGDPGVVRDFSDEQWSYLESCLDKPICSITDNMGDFFLTKIRRYNDAKARVKGSYKKLFDINDTTRRDLAAIFGNSKAVDQKYGHSIAGGSPYDGDYYTSSFSCIALVLFSLRDLLDKMAEIIDPANGAFTVEKLKALDPCYQAMLQDLSKLMQVQEHGAIPSIGTISDFASQKWAKYFFSDVFIATQLFVTDLGLSDIAGMTVFQMFDIFESKVTGEDYEQNLRKQLLQEMLESLTNQELYRGSEYEAQVDACKDFLDKAKSYGFDVYYILNHSRIDKDGNFILDLDRTRSKEGRLVLDGRTVNARAFRDMLKSFDSAMDILSYGNDAIDYIARLTADYSAGLEILESYEENFSGAPETQKAIQDIKALYNKEFSAWCDEAVDYVKEKGYGLALKELAKASPVIKVVTTIDLGIDIVGETTGLGTQARAKFNALTYYQLQTDADAAYKVALEKFQNADPSDPNYEKLAHNVNNMFNLTKENTIRMFEEMAKAENGQKAEYYRYCARQTRKATMNSPEAIKIMSYEQFCA